MRTLLSALRRRPGCAAGAAPDAEVWQAMAGILAHDLRAPAAAILALSDLQRLRALPGDAFVEQVAGQARQALVLADELAALLREPRHAYRMAPLDLLALLQHRIASRWWGDAEGGCRDGGAPRLRAHADEAWVRADARMLGEAIGVMLERVCLCRHRAGGCDVELRRHPVAGVHLAIRARGAGDAATQALSAAAPAGLLVRRVLHRHGGALLSCGERQADGAVEWRLALPALVPGRRRAPNKKAPEGAFLPSVA
ncbi:hypothetical protein K6V92_07235 [Cupriavidus respiraculi]|uniref:hypothetical protein n=1 Tax=Cupriavidus respiraculi TaxID=195930 RepID=UPI001C963D97|nr:hypothetical protein [Cupriavidus respiraculi]MBY4946415.1 hypothetical protein [Cupriavidus respiraculi]